MTDPTPSSRTEADPTAVAPPEAPSASSGPTGHVDWSKPRVAAILKAAVRCFARSGFDTTTAEIAADIGIPKSVIYHYFDDKTTLVREAQRFAYAEHLAKIKEALANIHEKTGVAVVDVLRMIWRAPESRSVSFQIGIWSELRNDAKVREQAVALRREHHRMIAGGVARSLGIDDPARTEPLSTLVTAALTGLSLEAFIEGNDELAGQAHELFLGILQRGIERFAKRPDSDVPPPNELDVELPAPYDSLERRLS